jgi:hypothetical protein
MNEQPPKMTTNLDVYGLAGEHILEKKTQHPYRKSRERGKMAAVETECTGIGRTNGPWN